MTAGRESTEDPRAFAPAAGAPESSVRPVVALPRAGPSGLLFAIAILAAGAILFVMLDSRRRSLTEPSVKAPVGETAVTAPPPPLYLPPTPQPQAQAAVPASQPPPQLAPQHIQLPPPPSPAPRIVYTPPRIAPLVSTPPVVTPRPTNSPTLVIDTTAPASGPAAVEAGASLAGQGALPSGGRVRSGVFANPSTTVVQGTLIPAVLETAFDSTRPGLARAIVSHDVRGFDGRRVLVPRGSRLTGEYRSDVAPGQKRALINWTRLIRPDGVTIALGSPAGDTLGRGGVRGSYNSHFFERFAGAILQSVLNIGTNVASRAASGNVIVALPGSQTLTPLLPSDRVAPTLTVAPGTSISVFVARDLDFSGAEKAR